MEAVDGNDGTDAAPELALGLHKLDAVGMSFGKFGLLGHATGNPRMG